MNVKEPAPNQSRGPGSAHLQVRSTRHRGRTSAATRARIDVLSPTLSVPIPTGWTTPELSAAFGRPADLIIDIGVGSGDATWALAEDRPRDNILALEVHLPSIGRLLARLNALGPPNVRVGVADAVTVLSAIPRRSVAGIRVLFPDPWPKRRHLKRRLVDASFLDDCIGALSDGGTLHVATDSRDYAMDIRRLASKRQNLTPRPGSVISCDPDGSAWCSDRPPRPTTVYEARARHQERMIHDLVWIRGQ